jgi:hypothetical protein
VVVPRAVAGDHIRKGALKVLAQLDPSQSGVHALFQTGTNAELARRAIDVLIERVTRNA